VLPDSLQQHRGLLAKLAHAYKQINAPLGTLGLKTLVGISTQALEGSDAVYTQLEDRIADITARRNAIAGQMIDILEDAAFGSEELDVGQAQRLIDQAEDLLASL
jgi:hypothetical protein